MNGIALPADRSRRNSLSDRGQSETSASEMITSTLGSTIGRRIALPFGIRRGNMPDFGGPSFHYLYSR